MELSEKQLDTLRHMLGINTPYDHIPRPNRNYAAVNPGDSKFAELESLGMVECYRRHDLGTHYDWFKCTDAGRLAAMRSHRNIRKSKSARRYAKFLEISDVHPDLTFKDFLTLPDFEDLRKNI